MVELPSSVLFACTWNSVRSPMAEGIMKNLVGTRMFVDSVGVRKGQPDGFTIAVLDEIGVDLNNHRPKTFEKLEDESFDLVISLSPEAQHKAVEMTRTSHCEVEFWHTMDPSIVEGSRETRLHAYRDMRDQLHERLRQRFASAHPPIV
ncbi:MAG: low molecular weight phosphatase family protein [Alphaproteobacteria bacterium]|jgi:protein-tyrosine-phosphatase|nr:low molecular weight phosphatase family protein [Alphaproteobacteria bacterium]MDP6819725.1 low molecular weight phosphatase family protein [Alphaproteobacteria bacterium]